MNDRRSRAVARGCGLLVALALAWQRVPAAEEPAEALHLRIDRLIEADQVGPKVAPASDAEFLRRVSLDLTGMPPSMEDLRGFLADQTPDKRARVVDRLLDSPQFARHWATTLDVFLMERRAFQNVEAGEWQAFLLDAARRNRPFNELAAELLRQDGGDLKRRAPARFYLDRESAPNGIARDVGRIFFGRDLQCAQCHDHPLVEDYRQSDYQGLFAFFSPGSERIKMEGKKQTTFFPEAAPRDVAFDSVFVKGDHHLTGPRLPGGPELDEPASPPGDEYKVKPVGDVMPVPRHSRRAMLASLIAAGGNRAFNENLANRLWAMMMGRGLVHPVDLHHPGNPPSRPELLALLGREIAALRFDVKAFLRELALTRVYQRSIDLPVEVPPRSSPLTSELAELRSQAAILESAAEGAKSEYRSAEKAWHRAEAAVIPLAAEEEKALSKHAAVAKKEEEARTAHAAAEAAVAARRDVARALAEAAGRAQEVVKKLPKEKNLAEAARVFASRSTAAATELAAAEKASGETAAAFKRIGEERAAVVRTVEAIRARIRPVREAARREEAVALKARGRLAEARAALENHRRRVAALEAYGHWVALRERIAENHREIDAEGRALAEYRKRSDEQAGAVRGQQEEVGKAVRARDVARKGRDEAVAARERYRKAMADLDAAVEAIREAETLLAPEAVLSGMAEGLVGKAGKLRSDLPRRESSVQAAESALRRAEDAARAADQGLNTARAEARRLDDLVAGARAKLDAAMARGEGLRREMAEAAEELTTALGQRFEVAQLRPLTPEQMGWSILKVTGVYDRYRAAEEAELARSKPLAGAAAADPAARRARAIEVEQRTFDKLKGNIPAFVRIYAASPGQTQDEFFATADQALFAANAGSIQGWIAPAGGNVSERMIAEKDARKAAEDLYLTILSRPPTEDEAAEAMRLLGVPAKEKPAVVQGLVWGLLASVEFRFNH